MKKLLSAIIVMTMLLSSTMFPAYADSNKISVYLNGSKIEFDVSPQIINDRTMIPVRAVAEKLNIDIQWDSLNKVVKMQTDTKEILMPIDDNWCECNGFSIFLDSPPIIFNDRTLVPLRFIAEQLNMEVKWDEIKKRIDIQPIGNTTYDTIMKEYVENGVKCRKVYTGELIDGVPYGVGKLEIFFDGDKHQEITGCFYNSIVKGYAEIVINDYYRYGGFFDKNGELTDGYRWAKFMDASYLEGTFYSNKGECHYENAVLGVEYWGQGKFIENSPFDTNGSPNTPFSLVADGYGKMNGLGNIYEGYFTEGVLNSCGKIYYADSGRWYEGDISNFLPHGYGTLYERNGNVFYSGTYWEGKPDGTGKMYYENGNLAFDGTFENGEMVYGKAYNPDGSLGYEGYIEWFEILDTSFW